MNLITGNLYFFAFNSTRKGKELIYLYDQYENGYLGRSNEKNLLPLNKPALFLEHIEEKFIIKVLYKNKIFFLDRTQILISLEPIK